MKTFFIQITFILATIITLVSCNQISKEEQEFDALMTKVIDVHDEVMPKMGELSTLISELKPKIDTTAQGKTYEHAQQELKNSYDFMMKWMADFSATFPPEKPNDKQQRKIETKMKLLQEEEVKVLQLKDQINASIDNAKKLLNKS